MPNPIIFMKERGDYDVFARDINNAGNTAVLAVTYAGMAGIAYVASQYANLGTLATCLAVGIPSAIAIVGGILAVSCAALAVIGPPIRV